MNVGSPLADYARFHVRDALPRTLVPIGLVAFTGGLPLWGMTRELGLESIRSTTMLHGPALGIFTQAASLAMTLGAILLMSGLVALDRERQYFRFLFGKPVAPWRFYLQRFAIATALFVPVFALIPVTFRLVFFEVPVAPWMLAALLYALLYGSLAMLCGALMNRDGGLFILIVLAGNVFQQLAKTDQLPTIFERLAQVLPPFQTADGVRTAWLAERSADAGEIGLVVAYSLAMLVLALYLIRARPLAR